MPKPQLPITTVVTPSAGEGEQDSLHGLSFMWGAPAGTAPPQLEGFTRPLGQALFSQYLLPFEIVSVLLLVAMVGVVLLSKKDLK